MAGSGIAATPEVAVEPEELASTETDGLVDVPLQEQQEQGYLQVVPIRQPIQSGQDIMQEYMRIPIELI